MGRHGLRAGWSVALFAVLFFVFSTAAAMVLAMVHMLDESGRLTPRATLFGELTWFVGLIAAGTGVALIEQRGNLLAFNLRGPRPALRFAQGAAAGLLALSALVGALTLGGWLQFGPVALTGGPILKYAALWAFTFLLVGCVEEGVFRCYLQFALARGIDFWWALGLVALMCGFLALRSHGNGPWGVYAAALLGLAPCLMLQLRQAEGQGFWQAAWVTSTLFGFIHTSNNGENWIGIFAAALIGFVFVVSIRVTGSAWWAIGCHAAWDWAETYFYGTADSGMAAVGHYLTTTAITPAGQRWAALWSGGADGPEGSLLVIPIVLLLLAALIAFYGRQRPAAGKAA
jgi:hypothetical protein